MSETELVKQIQIVASTAGARVFRNNCGQAWLGDAVKLNNGDIIIRNPRVVKYGVGNPGGSDLIGWNPVVITPEMVGKTVAVFTAIEVKAETGRVTKEQQGFLNAVTHFGGIGFIARNEDQAVEKLSRGAGGK